MATIKSEQQLHDVLQQRRPRAVITSGSFEVSIARSSRQARARIVLGGVAVLKLSGESDLTVTDRAVLCFQGDCTVECSNEKRPLWRTTVALQAENRPSTSSRAEL